MIATFVKKYWKWLASILIVSILMVRLYDRFLAPQPPVPVVKAPVVELYTLGDFLDENINLSCQVEPVSEVAITPEGSGTITKIHVKEGDTVKEGDILFEIENIQERVSVADARVALQSAELAYQEILDNNSQSSGSSLLAQTQAQQDALVYDALNNLFNNDLQAYPEDKPEDANQSAPSIIGNYNCAEEGDYIINVYSSSSVSGASFRYRGLEAGTGTVSTTNFGILLGSCGLELIFPEDFDKNETWIISVPNTRSSSYVSVKKKYEAALETRNIALNKTGLSDQELAQERGRVNQARLRYELALDGLSKTIIRAENNGVLSGFDLDKGDYIASFKSVGNIKTVDQLELVGYINANEKRYIDVDSVVTILDKESIIKSISATVDSLTRKLKITIAAPEDITLIEGLSVPCSLERSTDAVTRLDGGAVIPLSAVSIIGIDPYVFILNEEGMVETVSVTTGSILGNQIIVYGLEGGNIIRDARGIRSGEIVRVKEK